jgi:tRNA nucleotidyltransferase (CCA-adding enzyme)
VASETLVLMKAMVKAGEVNALVAERVWKEFERALGEKSPTVFFKVLADCEALELLFPMIEIEGPGLKALQQTLALTADDPLLRFLLLTHVFSKENLLWFCERYRLPAEYRELALLFLQHHSKILQFSTLSAAEMLNLLLMMDAFRREQRFQKLLQATQLLAHFKGLVFSPERIQAVYQAAKQVEVKDCLEQGLEGFEIAEKLKEKRLIAIQTLQFSLDKPSG